MYVNKGATYLGGNRGLHIYLVSARNMLCTGIPMQEGTVFSLRPLESFPSPPCLHQSCTYFTPWPYSEYCHGHSLVPSISPKCSYLKTKIYATALIQKGETGDRSGI